MSLSFLYTSLLHQFADQIGVAGGVLQRHAGDELGLVVQQGCVLLCLLGVGGDGVLQSDECGVLHIQLQHMGGLDVGAALDAAEIALHLEADAVAGGQAHGMGLQTGGGLDRLHLLAQSFLHKVKGGLVGIGGFLGALGVAVGQLVVQHGAEGLLLIVQQGVGNELVPLLGEVQNLGAGYW